MARSKPVVNPEVAPVVVAEESTVVETEVELTEAEVAGEVPFAVNLTLTEVEPEVEPEVYTRKRTVLPNGLIIQES